MSVYRNADDVDGGADSGETPPDKKIEPWVIALIIGIVLAAGIGIYLYAKKRRMF